MITIEELANNLRANNLQVIPSGDGFLTNCPCHDDSTPSLWVTRGTTTTGKTYTNYYCFTGCHWQDIATNFQDRGISPKPKKCVPSTNYSPKSMGHSSFTGLITKPRVSSPVTSKEEQKDYTFLYRYVLDSLDDREAVQRLERRLIPKELTQKHQIKSLPKDTRGIEEDLLKNFDIGDLVNSGLFYIKMGGKPRFVLSKHKIIIPYTSGEKIITLQGRYSISMYEKIPEEISKYCNLKKNGMPLYNMQGFQDARNGNKKVCIFEGAFDVLCVYVMNSTHELDFIEKHGHPIGIPGVTTKSILNILKNLQGLQVTIGVDNDKAGKTFHKKFKQYYYQRYNAKIGYLKGFVDGVTDMNEHLLYINDMW